jgi:hypothetical protein
MNPFGVTTWVGKKPLACVASGDRYSPAGVAATGTPRRWNVEKFVQVTSADACSPVASPSDGSTFDPHAASVTAADPRSTKCRASDRGCVFIRPFSRRESWANPGARMFGQAVADFGKRLRPENVAHLDKTPDGRSSGRSVRAETAVGEVSGAPDVLVQFP